MLLGEGGQFSKGGLIAIHGKNTIGDDQGMAMIAAMGGQQMIKAVHIIMGKTQTPGLGQPRAAVQAGMGPFINDDEVLTAHKNRNRADIGR